MFFQFFIEVVCRTVKWLVVILTGNWKGMFLQDSAKPDVLCFGPEECVCFCIKGYLHSYART